MHFRRAFQMVRMRYISGDTMLLRRSFAALGSLGLVACTTTLPPVYRSHPASTAAAEAPRTPAVSLKPDANTLRTRELLAAREAQMRAMEAERPIDELSPPTDAQRTSPGPLKSKPTHQGHEHH
jgi:hypothetical protein